MKKPTKIKQLSNKNNFVYLFFSLITLLFSATVIVEFPDGLGEDIFSFLILIMLFVSIKSLNANQEWKWTVYVIIVFFILLTIFGKFVSYQISIYLTLFTLLVFFVHAFIIATKQVLFVGDIDTNKIIGSLTLYILLGLIWTMIYLIILSMDPQAFSGIEASNWQQIFSRVAYYSFVTLTTLGYGDVLPTNYVAEFFVYMEAITGVFYMAIIVASLISLHLASIQDAKQDK